MTADFRRLALAAALAAACLPISACGNKGSLVRPPPAADAAPPADELPPATEPTEADTPVEIPPPLAGDPPSDPADVPASGDGDG